MGIAVGHIAAGVLPVFAIIAVGALLRRAGVVGKDFLTVSDRVVYYVFFPALLFRQIARSPVSLGDFGGLILTAVLVVTGVFFITVFYTALVRMERPRVGSFIQNSIRFSSYVGLATATSLLGNEGAHCFGVLMGFVIPLINVLSVCALVWRSAGEQQSGSRGLLILKAVAVNPLILACAAGMAASMLEIKLPKALDAFLVLLSAPSLGLALISVGGFMMEAQKGAHFRETLVSAAFKLVLMPLVGYAALRFFEVGGIAFITGMIYFALPTSPSNHILSSQLGGDAPLAVSGTTWTTGLSLLSLSVVAALFL
jgi:predicted permease